MSLFYTSNCHHLSRNYLLIGILHGKHKLERRPYTDLLCLISFKDILKITSKKHIHFTFV